MPAPSLTGFSPSITFGENLVNGTPQIIDGDVTFTDADNDFNGGHLNLTGVLAEDRISVRNQGTGAGQIGLSGSNVTYGGVVIGVLSGGVGANLTITFNASATSAAIDALIQNLTYADVSNTPTAARDLVLNVTDAAGHDLITPAGAANLVQQTGANNPFAGFGAEGVTTPTFLDIDGDGDMDMVSGNGGGLLSAYRNNGNGTFTQLTGANNPFNGIHPSAPGHYGAGYAYGYRSAPTAVDIDGDGDMDVVSGGSYGDLFAIRNNGNGTFTLLTDAANPFRNINTAHQVSSPTFVDLDNDGDMDLVAGSDGHLQYWQNMGGGSFVERTGGSNPLSGVSVDSLAAPAFADLDGDGDMDLLVGSYVLNQTNPALNSGVHAYRNNGDGTFTELTGANNPLNGIDIGEYTKPAFADVDGDGDMDLVVGSLSGAFAFFRNTGTPPSHGRTITVNVTPEADSTPHTGGVSVTGTATEDQVLTADASTLADADGLGTLHYDWQRDTGSGFTSIGAADQATYTLGDADVGATVRVVISYTDGGGNSESATSAATGQILGVNDPHTGGASITGTATEDQVLTAVSTLADVDGIGTLHYDWQRDTGSGFVSTGAADQATYTLGDADVGGVVRVVISYTDAQGFTESATSAGTSAIANLNDAHTGGVSVTGTAAEDQVLTADTSTLSDVDGLGTLHYDWQRDTGSGFVSTGAADQATYTLGDADVGGVVRVVVSYTDGHGSSESATSAGTSAISSVDDAPTGGVSITGTVTEDQVLTADTSTLADVDGLGTLHYDWQRDSGSGFVSTGAADQATYTLGDADVGASVRVVVSYTDGQGFSNSVTSAGSGAVGNVDDAAVARDDANFTNEDATVSGDVFADNGSGADSDIDGPALTVAAVNGSAANVGVQITLPSGALLTLNADGTYTYDPNHAFDYLTDSGSGGTNIITNDSFTYTLANGNTATVTVAVVGVDSNGDVVQGDGNNNILDAGDGDDTVIGGGGDDTLNGGAGTDTADYSGAASGVRVRLAQGDAPNDGDGGHDTLISIENATGSAFNDTLQGSTGANVLSGGAGYDVLCGLGGDDTLIGGSGAANEMYGGLGDDTYVVDANDTIIELLNQGYDTVRTSLNSFTLGANFEALAYTGAGSFSGVGNGLDNALTGGGGADILQGRGGVDTLNGGGGIDTASYAAAAAGVTASLAAGGASDDGDGSTDSFTSIENLTGSAFDDVLTGDGGANTLSGGVGDDVLNGRGGNDILSGGVGIDTASYADASAGVTVRLALGTASDGEGGTDTLVAIENVTGSAFNDTLYGNAGDNVLSGGVGRDTLLGLDGNDTLMGGSGVANELYGGVGDDTYIVDTNDTIVELAGQGTDTIVTTVSAFTIAANVENMRYVGSGAFYGVGNDLANVMTGGFGDDFLVGGKGDDTLNGFGGTDTVVMTGSSTEYTIEYLGGSSYRITDNVAGRDGVDLLNGIEHVQFNGNNVTGILNGGITAPLEPVDKHAGDAQVLPTLSDDDFVLGKEATGPQVLPGIDEDQRSDVLHFADQKIAAGFMLTLTDEGQVLHAPAGHDDFFGGAWDHDGWAS